MIINAVTGALIYGLKAFFSLISWFAKSFLKFLKLLYVLLPVTCIVFVLLFLVNIFMLCTSGTAPMPEEVPQKAEFILIRDSQVVSKMFGELKVWWLSNVFSLHGSASYIFLLILTVLMFLPVMCILLCFSVFSGFGSVLFIAIVVDAALYLIRALTGSSFLKQAQGRYFRFFPEAGRRHYEKSYHKFLKKRDKEMREEIRQGKRNKGANFYEEVEDLDEDEYDDRRYDRRRRYEDDPVDDFFEDDVDDEDFYEDEEFDEEYGDEDYDDEDYENYEDDYDDPKRHRHYRGYDEDYDDPGEKAPQPSSSFDFFAGCTSRESVDKKYKSLVKLYHPDNMDGDTAALQEINAQYAEAKKRFS